jgi:hypothetical protein
MSVYANNKDVKLGPYQGKILNYEEIKVAADNIIKNKLYPKGPTEYSDWVVKINGNSAFVTEKQVNTQNNGIKTGSMKADYLEKINGEWKIVDHRFSPIANTVEEDEAAIKSTIEGETNAFKLNDANKTTSFWLNTPYTSHSYTAKGLGYVRGANVGITITDYLKANPKIDNSPTNYHDYIIRINGNSAWATYISDSTSNGKKVVYNKAVYLEKTNGEWKICSMHSTEAK